MNHVIFYDGECPLCQRAVRFLLWADRKHVFYFAPLRGETAQKKQIAMRIRRPQLDTLVLLENYNTLHEKAFIEGRGALRILWLLGGRYRLLGWLSFLPSFLFDPLYRLVARYRYRLFSQPLTITVDPSRFLK